MNVLEHLANSVYLPLKVFGLDISITKLSFNLWVVVGMVWAIFYFTGRAARLLPGKWQTFIELLIEFVRNNVTSVLEDEAERFFPFLFTLFSLILFSNLMGLLPGFLPPTSNINVTATLAVIVFLTAHFLGIRRFGFLKYVKSMVPAGVPKILFIFIIPIEIVSQLARPFSLAVRLFANLLAGHIIPIVLISLIFLFKNYLLAPLPLAGNVVLGLFEIFISFIQAYIFAFLAAIYLASAIKPSH
jgi:F-type H+-transporting ATPase subunit a